MSTEIFIQIKRLWVHINQRRRFQIYALIILMVISSFIELISISAVLPFLKVLSDPDSIFKKNYMRDFINIFKINEPKDLILPITLLFILASVLAAIMRIIIQWFTNRVSYLAGSEIGLNIYRRTLYQPYQVHVMRNSSEVINGITGKSKSIINGILIPIINILSSSIFIVIIMCGMLIVNPKMTILSLFFFSILYFIVIKNTNKRLIINSQKVAVESTKLIKLLQDSLGGIRDILLDGTQEIYCKLYRNTESIVRKAQSDTLFISQSPRYVMESLGIIFVSILGYIMSLKSGGMDNAIPSLALLALSGQRLLPIFQQAYASLTSIKGNHASLVDILDFLDQKLPLYIESNFTENTEFNNSIEFKNIYFSYDKNNSWVLRDINLKIMKGERIGIIGSTGSGKSTLLDVLMNLLEPTHGFIEIDGVPLTSSNKRSWQLRIANVPQSVFLADLSILENIALGISKQYIDLDRAVFAAKKAQISDFIDMLPDGYNTVIGERGVRLSGGQRQRLGIARALYKKVDVIIFDEATSSLDNKTEQAIINSIYELGKDFTLLSIAHRITTLKECTRIYEIEDGTISRIGTYKEFFDQNSQIEK